MRIALPRPVIAGLLAIAAMSGCQISPPEPPTGELVREGERLFFNETFGGNGRTCGTCHRAEDNFGLTPAFIAGLPPEDPLFVAERMPDLGHHFENPALMREFAVVIENQDGFDDLANDFNLRGVPHTLALRTSVDSAAGPRTGWSGDGSPGDGTVRSFATGAVIQHFPLTLNRIPGVDFRLPTDHELDALEAFQLSLGRQEDLSLPLSLTAAVVARGQEIFMDRGLGKCNACHLNAGANADPELFGAGAGNLNFSTGVENLPDQPARLSDEFVPGDDGHGIPGSGEFNTPPVVEAADTGPFFHNNSVETIEAAVAFYNGNAFNESPAGQLLQNATGSGINLDATQVVAVAAFLRVINALENIRASMQLLDDAGGSDVTHDRQTVLLERAAFDIDDGVQVLSGGGLHPHSAADLNKAIGFVRQAVEQRGRQRGRLIGDARAELARAKGRMVTP